MFLGFDFHLWFSYKAFPHFGLHSQVEGQIKVFFFFHKSVGMSAMDVEATDAFFDLTTVDTQLMNKDVFHRDLN